MYMKKSIFMIVLLTFSILFILSQPGMAVIALPDAGINYNTMKVTDSSKLMANGMKRVQNGDTVTIKPDKTGRLLITDVRTGETIRWVNPKK
jgi:hypothetical protein